MPNTVEAMAEIDAMRGDLRTLNRVVLQMERQQQQDQDTQQPQHGNVQAPYIPLLQPNVPDPMSGGQQNLRSVISSMPTSPEAPAPTSSAHDSSPAQDGGHGPTNNPLLDRLEQQQRARQATGLGRGRGRSSSWRPTAGRGSSATSRVASPVSGRSAHSVHTESAFMMHEDENTNESDRATYIEELATNPDGRPAASYMRQAMAGNGLEPTHI